MFRWLALAGLCLIILIGPLKLIAQTNTSPQQLFNQGRFLDAAIAGQDMDTPEGLVLAAKAHLVIARFYADDSDRDNHIQAAMDAATEVTRRAPSYSPLLAEAYFQLGAAWGLRARYEKSASYAKKSRDFLRQALELAPDSAPIHAGLGGWNGEAVARAGSFMARMILGAKRSRMEELFARALRLEPDNLSILSGHATTLLRLGKKADVELAHRRLEAITGASATTALEIIIQTYAGQLLRALNVGDEKQLQDLLDHYKAPDFN